MVSILDRYNEHLFLEHNSNKTNSFIANVNLIASKFNELVCINEKFDAEAVKLLVQLVKNSLDSSIKQISDDLRKGSYNGYRKLDIDLLTNFKDYSFELTDEEKNALWNDPAAQVYYDSIEVYFTDGSNISKVFKEPVRNHHQIYDELADWDELKNLYGDTFFNLSPDTPIKNHELIRFVDGVTQSSDIEKIVLHVATNGQNTAYDEVFAGVKSYTPTFTWIDTTSALITIAHRVNDILHAADYIEQVGIDFAEILDNAIRQAEAIVILAEEYKNSAASYAARAEEVLNKQMNLKVTTNVLPVNANPVALYNAEQNILSFGLPRTELAVVGLSNFAIDTANGHLTLETIHDEDVNRVYVNDDGNVIIEMK
jgi:hypothetical protein